MRFRNGFEGAFDNLPDFHDEDFATGHFALHEIDVEVQVFMIYLLDYLPFNDITQQLKVNHKTCIGIRFALYRYDQFKIMPVPVNVSAGAKNFFIALLRPGRIVEPVSRIEVLNSVNIDHFSGLDGAVARNADL